LQVCKNIVFPGAGVRLSHLKSTQQLATRLLLSVRETEGVSAMRRVLSTGGFLLILLALGCAVTHADTIDFVISGTYAGNVPGSPLSSPNSAFSLSFSLPDAPAPLSFNVGSFTVTAPLTVGFSGTTTTDPLSLIVFFTDAAGGLFDVHAT